MNAVAPRRLQLLKIYLSLLPLTFRAPRPADFEQIKRLVRLKFPTVRHLTTTELAAWLTDKNRKPPAIFDARSEQEYAVSHLKDAMRLDSSQIDRMAAERDKTQPVVIYCAVGWRSSAMAIRLAERGFTNVCNLEGSIFQWAIEKRPLFRDDQPVNQVHPYSKKWEKLLA